MQSGNLYAYCGNNPLTYVDPDGRSYLVYIRSEQRLYLFSSSRESLGSWRASNNPALGHTPFPSGTWLFAYITPDDNPNDPGIDSLGFIGFKGTSDKGIHSGRTWDAGTNGCIRTERLGMTWILIIHGTGDPLRYIDVWDSWLDYALGLDGAWRALGRRRYPTQIIDTPLPAPRNLRMIDLGTR